MQQSSSFVWYKKGYKYQLTKGFTLDILIAGRISTEYISLDMTGNLTIKRGYAWDGVSGPVGDNINNMRASLVHDALYQLMREGLLNYKTHRELADRVFKDLCIKDGVPKYIASIYYFALRKFGKRYAMSSNMKEIFCAPK